MPPAEDSSTGSVSAARRLEHFYRAYIASINGRRLEADLPRFCAPTVTHNGRRLSLAEYAALIRESQEAIPDLRFHVHTVVAVADADADADAGADTGRIAARIEFTGTPAGTWAGVAPNGKGLDRVFSEHVFYWLEDGKIREVVSLLDLDKYRELMGAGA